MMSIDETLRWQSLETHMIEMPRRKSFYIFIFLRGEKSECVVSEELSHSDDDDGAANENSIMMMMRARAQVCHLNDLFPSLFFSFVHFCLKKNIISHIECHIWFFLFQPALLVT